MQILSIRHPGQRKEKQAVPPIFSWQWPLPSKKKLPPSKKKKLGTGLALASSAKMSCGMLLDLSSNYGLCSIQTWQRLRGLHTHVYIAWCSPAELGYCVWSSAQHMSLLPVLNFVLDVAGTEWWTGMYVCMHEHLPGKMQHFNLRRL